MYTRGYIHTHSSTPRGCCTQFQFGFHLFVRGDQNELDRLRRSCPLSECARQSKPSECHLCCHQSIFQRISTPQHTCASRMHMHGTRIECKATQHLQHNAMNGTHVSVCPSRDNRLAVLFAVVCNEPSEPWKHRLGDVNQIHVARKAVDSRWQRPSTAKVQGGAHYVLVTTRGRHTKSIALKVNTITKLIQHAPGVPEFCSV